MIATVETKVRVYVRTPFTLHPAPDNDRLNEIEQVIQQFTRIPAAQMKRVVQVPAAS